MGLLLSTGWTSRVSPEKIAWLIFSACDPPSPPALRLYFPLCWMSQTLSFPLCHAQKLSPPLFLPLCRVRRLYLPLCTMGPTVILHLCRMFDHPLALPHWQVLALSGSSSLTSCLNSSSPASLRCSALETRCFLFGKCLCCLVCLCIFLLPA
jgi:hypothetical protein